MKFRIRVIINGRQLLFQVEKTSTTPNTEDYQIAIQDRSITLQTNRLLFKTKELKDRKGVWKIIEGDFTNSTALDIITEAIERRDPLI
jgi:hypothetical protein